MNILCIDGHWKDGRQLGRLAEETIASARAEANYLGADLFLEWVLLRDFISTEFDPETEDPPLPVKNFLKSCMDADGLLFFSPIMGGGVSPHMTAALGYIYKLEFPHYYLRGKPFGVVVHGKEDGGRSAVMAIAAQLALDLDMRIPSGTLFYCIQDGAEKSEGEWMLHYHRVVGQNLVRDILVYQTTKVDVNGWQYRE